MLEEIIFQEAMNGNADVLEDVEHFTFDDIALSVLYKYVKQLYYDGHKITFDAVRNKLNTDKYIREKSSFLDRLNDVENGSYYYLPGLLDEFKKGYKERVARSAGKRLSSAGSDTCTVDDVQDVINGVQAALDYGVKEEDIVDNTELDERLFSKKGGVKRIPLTDNILKCVFGNSVISRLYVLSGYSSMGKNIIVDNLALDMAKNGLAGVYFSFDNTAVETRATMYSIEARIPYQQIEERNYDSYDLEKFRGAKFRDHIHIVDRKKTSRQMCRILQIAKKRYNIHWFVVDYFQNIKLPSSKDTVRHFEQAAIDLKTVCNELDITGIILSQQNDQGSVKWCRGLFEEAYYLVKIDGERQSNVRKVSIEKYKKGALASYDIQYDASIGALGWCNV